MKFNEIPCICCGNIIINIPTTESAINTERKYHEVNMWYGGEVSKVEFKIHSTLYGSVFYIGVCDSCATLKANNGGIYFSHDYMDSRNNDSDIAKSWKCAMVSKIREIQINKIIKDE
jgi:hypothetical protein